MQAIRQRFKWRWLFILSTLVVIVWLGCNIMINPKQVDERLTAQGKVIGGEAVLTGIAWYSAGVIPRAALVVTLEMENPGTIDLEIIEVIVMLRDSFGREQQEVLQHTTKTNPPPPLLQAGETRMVDAGALFYNTPLTWNQMEVQVYVQPASSETLGRTIRWNHTQVTQAEYDQKDIYHLAGWSKDANFVTETGVGVRPQTIVSFYNEEGEFIGGDYIALNGLGKFDQTFVAERFPKGPIASYRIHFIEAFTPYPINE